MRDGARGAHLEDRLRALAERRTGRPCLMLPSGRLALFLALRHRFTPGERILMSPVNDDVILFVVLAAGLRPVSAPVSQWTGNIDVTAVPESTWRSVAGVLTTNLYGIPDSMAELRRRCDRFGLTLVEDACHAIDTVVDGRLVGTFGVAGAYSLSKHAGAMAGGFLAVADAGELRALERLRDEALAEAGLGHEVLTIAKSLARPRVKKSPFAGPVWKVMRALRLEDRSRWSGYRMPLRADALKQALAMAPDLNAFEPWVRVDLADYRRRTRPPLLWWLGARLRAVESERQTRREGVARLASLPAATPVVRDDVKQGRVPPLFRVPLLIHERDRTVAALERHGVISGYIYDPPLDDYAGPEFIEPSPDPRAARWFARHALPTDPLHADRVVRLLQRIGIKEAQWTTE